MNKIKTLLEKANCSPELAESICAALGEYKTTLQEQYEADYRQKLEQAKKVCIDETDSHKRELARRVQIFCETKAAAIDAQLAKQSVHSESVAMTRLKSIQALLEGIEPNGQPNGSTAELERARRKIQQVNEEKARAVEIANRQTALAEKALKANRQLSAKLNTVVAESVSVPAGKPNRALDTRRKSTQPSTTRQTLLENQDRKPPAKNQPIMTPAKGFGVNDIAANMDSDLI